MFDDPKKQLDWMARELLAEEGRPTLPQDSPEDPSFNMAEEDDLMQRIDALIGDEPVPPQSHAADFTRMIHTEEPGKASRKTRAAKAVQTQVQTAAPVKQKGIKGLVFLAILETLGILAIIGWWIKWLT